MLREIALGFPYLAAKRLLRRTEYCSKAELEEIQRELLSQTVLRAVRKVPFYRPYAHNEQFYKRGTAEEILRDLPFIDKAIIRQNLKNLVSGQVLRRLKVTTGGSTGQPLVFYMDRFVTRQREKSFMFDQWSRVGYRFGDPIFNLRGRVPKRRRFLERSALFNTYFASSMTMNRETLPRYIDAVREVKPVFLHGYPSTLYQLARLLESTGRKLDAPLKAVFCGSERLFDYQRKIIEENFGCPAYSWYGQTEYVALGGECEYSSRYHFFPQYGYVELQPTGIRNDQGKELHELVATGFNNPVMPMIRYRTGDYVLPSSKQHCECGRNYLLVDEVVGREQEFVIDRLGGVVSATSLIFGQHYEIFAGLSAMQLYQDTPGEIEIRLVKNANFNARMAKIMCEKIGQNLEGRMNVHFSFVECIPRTALGKARLVDQRLPVEAHLNG